jgi:hypothetical protein
MLQRRLYTIQAFLLLACCIPLGCSVATLPVAERSPAGTYQGETADGRPIRLTVAAAPEGYVGFGNVDEVPFSLSLLTSYRAIGLITHNGRILPLEAALSFDRDTLTLEAFGAPIDLLRAGSPDTSSEELDEGGLAGRYLTEEGWISELELTEKDTMIVGSGRIYGRRFVLNGLRAGDDAFKGHALFADGSKASVSGQLDAPGRRLTVEGLAGRIELQRQAW